MLQEEKKNDRFGEFLNMFYANPMTDKKARKEYIKKISPEKGITKVAGKKATVFNFDQLKLIKQMQEQEARAKKGG